MELTFRSNWTREDKSHITGRPCIILYIITPATNIDLWFADMIAWSHNWYRNSWGTFLGFFSDPVISHVQTIGLNWPGPGLGKSESGHSILWGRTEEAYVSLAGSAVRKTNVSILSCHDHLVLSWKFLVYFVYFPYLNCWLFTVLHFIKIRRFFPDTLVSSINNTGQWRSVIRPIFFLGAHNRTCTDKLYKSCSCSLRYYYLH